MNHSGKLRVPESLYAARLDRLRRLINLNAPRVVLAAETELFLKCFKWSWHSWWHSYRLSKFPHWLLWLTMPDYRACCREEEKQENEEFEREMREMLGKVENP